MKKYIAVLLLLLSCISFLSAFALAVDDTEPSPVPSAEPSPSAEPLISDDAFRGELLGSVGRIESFLLFFVVVILAYFCYKFLRIFF